MATSRSHYRLNTKQCCFLCIKNISVSSGQNKTSTWFSIPKVLLRYLGVCVSDVIDEGTPGADKDELVAEICEECREFFPQASELAKDLELIEIELGHYLDKIQTRIKDGSRCPSRMKRYHRRMKSDSLTAKSLETVDAFRRQVSNKCSLVISKIKLINHNEEEEINVDETVKATQCGDDNADRRPAMDAPQPEFQQQLVRIPSPQLEVTVNNYGENKNNDEHDVVELVYQEPVAPPISLDSDSDIEIIEEMPHQLNQPPPLPITFLVPTLQEDPSPLDSIRITGICSKNPTLPNFTRNPSPANQPSTRNIHNDQNSNPKLMCKRCDKTFTVNSKHYWVHVRKCTHSGPIKRKTLKCKLCHRMFSSQSTLHLHQRFIHIKDKRFECHFCSKVFYRKDALTKHLGSVHLGIRYQCTFPGCLKSYAQKGMLGHHQGSEHPDFEPTEKTVLISRSGAASIAVVASNDPNSKLDSNLTANSSVTSVSSEKLPQNDAIRECILPD